MLVKAKLNMEKQEIDYKGFCTNVLKINEKIRFAAILDKNGNKVGGGYRAKVSSYLNPTEINHSLHLALKRWKSRDKLSNRIGHARFSLTEYEKVKQITIPIGKTHLLLLSTEISVNHTKLLEKICLLIDQYFRGIMLKEYASPEEIKKLNRRAIIAVKKDMGHVRYFSSL